MFDPLLTLIAAKAKAVGLVAGTAMVTAALAGGGAVAMTAVSHDGTVHEETVAEVVLDSDVATDTPVATDTGDDDGGEGGHTPPALPADFTCDESKNHGQNVSAYARSLEKGPGRGEKVSAVAQSDCGKKSGDELEEPLTVESEESEVEESEVEESEVEESEVEESEVEESEEPKAEKSEAKAEKKAAQAEKKAVRAEVRSERKAAKPAGGKGNGKNK